MFCYDAVKVIGDSCFIIQQKSGEEKPIHHLTLSIPEKMTKGVTCVNIKKHSTLIWVLIAILWIAVMVLGTTGHFVIGMVLSVPLMMLHMMLGVAKGGVVSKKFFFYPLLVWGILWAASFILSGYFANLYDGVAPAFTIFGLDPSFAPTIFLYWIGGQLTLNLGFYLLQDEWLSQKEWDDFCVKAKKIKEGVK